MAMPIVNLLRMAGALALCLLAACALLVALMHGDAALADAGTFFALLATTLIYAAPLAFLAALSTELLRLRQPLIHVGLGLAVAVIAAAVAGRDAPISAAVFTRGSWTLVSLVVVATFAGLTYWSVHGRRAGWRGNRTEQADEAVASAFEAGSSRAIADRNIFGLALWSVLALTAFSAFCWLSLALGGVQQRLVADVEDEGNRSLAARGHDWARFSVQDGRGVLTGIAGSQEAAEAAQAGIRETLAPVTGIPGVVAGIDSMVTVPAPAPPAAPAPAPAPEPSTAEQSSAEAASLAAVHAEHTESSEPSRSEPAAETPPQAAPESRDTAALTPPTDASSLPNEAMAGSDPAAEPPTAAAGQERAPCSSDQLAIIKSSYILFERQRAVIAANYDGELERLAAATRACAPWALLIAGRADHDGDNLFNEGINRLRAIAVRDELVARGVPHELLVAKAAADNDAARGQEEVAFNRRAEFQLVEPSRVSRDATQDPSERAENCDKDLSTIMSQSIIHFATGSSRVSDQSLDLIDRLAAAIKTCGSVVIMVEGHTDLSGTLQQNQQLSNRRANSVRELLVTAGADPTRVMSRGLAASQPYDPGQTAEAYALNRRIEFKVSGKFTSDNTGGP